MARHGVPYSSSLWQKYEDVYVGIFIMALRRLTEHGCTSTKEDDISEELCPLLRQICFEERRRRNDREIRTPDWEKPIQPVSRRELKGGRRRKRPDFTCTVVDTYTDSPDHSEIPFHVECKLLGKPTRRNWVLNKNYVTEGIKRFDSRSHEYGKRAFSGMMIGYIRDMTPAEILEQVNSYQKRHCSYNPAITLETIQESIRQYGHRLNRKNVKPARFRLIHLWVDLRKEENVR